MDFVEWLRGRQQRHAAVRLGIGDDMAVVAAGLQDVLLTSDMLLDGVHFDTACQPLRKIGRKAMACGLSDCAAMAVRPIAATVSVALPTDGSIVQAQELYEGMFAIAGEYDLAIVGGDTTRWNRRLAIDVAVLAIPYAGIEPVTRSGAKLGDILYVTGRLGGSLLGRHLEFTPRVHEAHTLVHQLGGRVHAMMDISDGLALDLWRMCHASNVGAMLDEGRLEAVINEDAREAAVQDGRTPLDHALSDGEDFELLVAAEGDVSDTKVTLYPLGEVTSGGFSLRRLDGRVEPLEPKGYVH